MEKKPRLVDLCRDDGGDRIAVVREGEVSYLPCRRFDTGAQHGGASGNCRYIKRAGDGSLYVTGPGLGNRLYCSPDGGRTWEHWELPLEDGCYIGAFVILHDDTLLLAFMPNYSEFREICLARSTDLGRSWEVARMDGDIRPYSHIVMDNGDLLELSDGTVLMTCNLRFMMRLTDAMKELPIGMWGSFAHLFRSEDGGRTWTEKHQIAMPLSAETHLLE